MLACALAAGAGPAPAAAAAAPRDAHGLPLWQARVWDDVPVAIPLSSRAAADELLAAVPLRDFHRESLRPDGTGWRLVLRIDAAEAAALAAAGYTVEFRDDIDRAGRREAERTWAARAASGLALRADPAAKSDAPAVASYPTHAEVGALLDSLAAARPDLCRRVVWGHSVQGRELWGLVVSADVQHTAAEPEVRLSGTMHGDEPVPMILLLNLAHHLVANYGQPGYEDLTALVDGIEIHLLPLHNPDGYVAGTRANARGVDLNRSFPEPTMYWPPEVETTHFMDYALDHHFVLSQNGHGGALVVNYPWDHTYTLAPDDAALIRLSLEYSTLNLPMFTGAFTDGITNGAAWYRVDGGLQDWSYDQTGCVDLTVEVGNAKWPPAADLPGYWDDNRDSLLALIASARAGLHGTVTDSLSGLPLDAVITVVGNPMTVTTDPDHGDWYRLLDTGVYDLVFSAAGYVSRTVSGVAVTWGAPDALDVQLVPDAADTTVPRASERPAVRAWPNPFNPATRILATVPAAGRVTVDIHDLRGARVRRLWDGTAAAGHLPLDWDGRDDAGASLASGAYLVRVRTEQGEALLKLTLVE